MRYSLHYIDPSLVTWFPSNVFPPLFLTLATYSAICSVTGPIPLIHRNQLRSRRHWVAAITTDDSNSRHCSEVSSQDRSHSIIESVEELKICKYIIHVCNPPTPNATHQAPGGLEEDQDQDLHLKTDPISESDAKEINQTMQRIHEVMHAYLHQTQSDAHQKSNPDRTTSLHVGLPPLPPSRIQANLQLLKDMFAHQLGTGYLMTSGLKAVN